MLKNKIRKILNITKEHWLILVFGLIASVLVSMPMLTSLSKIDSNSFKGVFPIFNADKSIYMTMTKEILDGHPGLGNPYIKEHKDMPFMYPPVSELLLAGMSKIFHVSIPVLFVINDFLLPFLEMLLLYFLFFKISKQKFLSAFFSFAFVLIYSDSFAMPINPQLSFIYLTVGIIIIWHLISKKFDPKKCFKLNIALSIPFILAFYTYPYFWTGILTLYGLNLLFFSIDQKNWKVLVYNALPFFVVSSTLAIPYFINMSKAISTGYYASTMARLGLYTSHFPSCYTNVFFIVLTALSLFLFYKNIKDRRKLYFSVTLLTAALLLNWQNVITGKTIQFASHYAQLTIFYCLITVFIMVYYIFKNKSELFSELRIKNVLVIVFLFLFTVTVLYKKIPTSFAWITTSATESNMVKYQKYGEVYDWLNANTSLDSAVFTVNNSEFNLWVPVYTHNNVLNIGYSEVFLMSDDEAEKRWLISNLFNDDVDADYFKNGDIRVWVNKYVNEFQNKQVRKKLINKITGKKGEYDNKFLPQKAIDKLIADNEELRRENLADVLKYFKIDYIVVDKSRDNYAIIQNKIEKSNVAEKVEEINNMLIYGL